MRLFRPGLLAFPLLVGVYLWGGSSRAVAFAATWWLGHPPQLGPIVATTMLVLGTLLALVGLGTGMRARRSGGEEVLWAGPALGFHAVILLAIVIALVMGWWEERWLGPTEMFGVRP